MLESIQQLFFLPNPALTFVTAAGHAWGFDVVSFDVVTGFFVIAGYIVALTTVLWAYIRGVRTWSMLLVAFSVSVFVLAHLIRWMSVLLTSSVAAAVDVSIEVMQVIGVCLLLGSVFMLFHEVRSGTYIHESAEES